MCALFAGQNSQVLHSVQQQNLTSDAHNFKGLLPTLYKTDMKPLWKVDRNMFAV